MSLEQKGNKKRPCLFDTASNYDDRKGKLVGEKGIGLHDFIDLGTDGGDDGLVLGVVEDALYEFGNLDHEVFFGSAGGDGRCAKTYARGLECAAAVEGYHVFVDCDVGCYEGVLGDLTCEVGILGTQVYKHRVVVGATADDIKATLDEFCS